MVYPRDIFDLLARKAVKQPYSPSEEVLSSNLASMERGHVSLERRTGNAAFGFLVRS
jgi:hypothetical protein